MSTYDPSIRYSKAGDEIQVYLNRDFYIAEWINHDLTLYRHGKTNEIVGFEIGNIKKLLKNEE